MNHIYISTIYNHYTLTIINHYWDWFYQRSLFFSPVRGLALSWIKFISSAFSFLVGIDSPVLESEEWDNPGIMFKGIIKGSSWDNNV